MRAGANTDPDAGAAERSDRARIELASLRELADDFAAARNESLRHARGEWVFWMDSDDTIDADNGRKLRALVNQPISPSVLGHVIQVHCPGSGNNGQADVTVVDHVKLLRNRPELRFEGRIHEQVLPAIRRAGAGRTSSGRSCIEPPSGRRRCRRSSG